MNAKMSFQTLNRPKLVDDVVNQLQKKISEGEIKPGEKIPTEPELMQQFGVGRSTIREAVRVLVHAGLLEKKQGFGTFLTANTGIQEPLDHRLRRAEILEVYEVRKMLELEISRLAAQRRNDLDLEQMRSALDQRQESLEKGDMSNYLVSDMKFHLSIAIASKNSVAIDLYRSFSTVFLEASHKLVSVQDVHDPHNLQHESMYQAIKDKDVSGAAYWTQQNLDDTVTQLKKYLNQE